MDDIIWPPKKPAGSRQVAARRPASDAIGPQATEEPSPPEDNNHHLEQYNQKPRQHDQPEHEEHLLAEPKQKRHWLYFNHRNFSKKQWAIAIVIILVLLAGGGYGAMALYNHFRKPAPQAAQAKVVKEQPAPAPTTGPSPLTGAEVALELTTRPVTGIMIENSLDARPQSGLKDAGIVYEAIAEGGITRFLALFQEARPGYIGPVRSVRPYYLDFLMPFSASIAHVGGAPQALADIKSFGVRDLDEFANSGAYSRITERFAPHNVYTSFDKLDTVNNSKGFAYVAFTPFPRKKEAPSTTPNAKAIDLSISGPIYNAHFDYNAPTNSYNRSEGGKGHVDEKSGISISPKVVIAMVVQRGTASDGQHTNYQLTGAGHIFVFQDGIVTEGSWSKADRKAQFVFTDAAGAELKLNPGQTWITLIDSVASVTVK